MRTIYIFLLVIVISANCSQRASDNNENSLVKTSVLVSGLHYPWEIIWGPDNMIWMTERGGRISRVDPSDGKVMPLINISEVESRGEGGLLGMALHPSFKTTPFVYVSYNYDRQGDYREKIVRFTYKDGTLKEPLVIIDNIHASGIHNGCRLLIIDSKLFITTGDASNQSNPQNINALNGKVLRINLDGSIPSDNPFPGNPVWSYGHRNPQGLVFANNIMYSSEHGPSSDDEINIIEKGRNYGWPNVEGYCNDSREKAFCESNNVKQPIHVWTPTEAVCGLDYYSSNRITEWKNSLLLCTLKGSKLLQLKLGSDKKSITTITPFFNNQFGRLRDCCISPEGKVYLCTSNGNDKIIVVE